MAGLIICVDLLSMFPSLQKAIEYLDGICRPPPNPKEVADLLCGLYQESVYEPLEEFRFLPVKFKPPGKSALPSLRAFRLPTAQYVGY